MRRGITKLYAEHVRKYVKVLAKKKYVKTPKGKKAKSKDDAKYHDKKKQDPEYIKKRNNYMKKYNNIPERKKRHSEIQKIHRVKPEIRKQNSDYERKRRRDPRVKDMVNRNARNWRRVNSELILERKKEYLNRLGIPFRMNRLEFRMALESWVLSVKKLLGEKCLVCNSTDRVNIHHIFEKVLYPTLALNKNNGIPLCHLHHNQAHGKLLYVRGI